MLFGECRQQTHRCRRRIAGAHYQSCFICIDRFSLAAYILKSVRDVLPSRDFTQGWDPAIAQPTGMTVDAGAVQHGVGFLHALLAFIVPN